MHPIQEITALHNTVYAAKMSDYFQYCEKEKKEKRSFFLFFGVCQEKGKNGLFRF